jgi:hypothetical protein
MRRVASRVKDIVNRFDARSASNRSNPLSRAFDDTKRVSDFIGLYVRLIFMTGFSVLCLSAPGSPLLASHEWSSRLVFVGGVIMTILTLLYGGRVLSLTTRIIIEVNRKIIDYGNAKTWTFLVGLLVAATTGIVVASVIIGILMVTSETRQWQPDTAAEHSRTSPRSSLRTQQAPPL